MILQNRWLVKYVQLCVNRRVNPSFHNGDHLQWLNYERRGQKRKKQQERLASYQFQGTWWTLALDLVILMFKEQSNKNIKSEQREVFGKEVAILDLQIWGQNISSILILITCQSLIQTDTSQLFQWNRSCATEKYWAKVARTDVIGSTSNITDSLTVNFYPSLSGSRQPARHAVCFHTGEEESISAASNIKHWIMAGNYLLIVLPSSLLPSYPTLPRVCCLSCLWVSRNWQPKKPHKMFFFFLSFFFLTTDWHI